MEPNLKKSLCLVSCEPDKDLASNIWHDIVVRDKRSTRIKLGTISSIGLLSLVGLIPTIKLLSADLSHSGFYKYFSLAFSDSAVMLSNWREFTLSLAESLPTWSIVISLSLVFIFLISFKYALKQITRNQLLLSF